MPRVRLYANLHKMAVWNGKILEIKLATKIINEPFIEYRGMSGSYSKF